LRDEIGIAPDHFKGG